MIAAGINLFGGPLGLIHRHVTGAIPIRRNAKDPAYLITLKAYVAEILGRHDLMFYIEGGRSYSGEMKSPKTGLVHAALQAERSDLIFLPCAVSYDLVLEDFILARQKVKRGQRPFTRELAEMVRYARRLPLPRLRDVRHADRSAAGYRSARAPRRAGAGASPSRHDRTADEGAADAYRRSGDAAVAATRPSSRRGSAPLVGAAVGGRRQPGAHRPESRSSTTPSGRFDRARDRGRSTATASACASATCCGITRGRSNTSCPCRRARRTDDRRGVESVLSSACSQPEPSESWRRATAWHRRPVSRGGSSPAKPSRKPSRPLARLEARGLTQTLDYLGESVGTSAEADAVTRDYLVILDKIVASGVGRNVSLKLTQLGLDLDRVTALDNLRRILEPATTHGFFVRIDMENSPYTDVTLDIVETLWGLGYRNLGVVLQSALCRSEADLTRLLALGVRVRLVKGAYREPAAVAYQLKADVDAAYLRMATTLLERGTFPALATHDPDIIDAVRKIAVERGVSKDRFEFQMLYGVRRDLQASLVADGYGMRVYVPFGRQWFPYFMRRLGERPANVAFVLRSLVRER